MKLKKLGTGKERRQNEKKLYLLVSYKRIKKIWQNNNNGWMEKERDREMKEVNKNFAHKC